MTSQRSFNPDLSSFKIPDLANHNNIRILAQKSPQSSRKIQTNFLVHLNLINSGKVKLNRIFSRRNVLCCPIQF